jgi:hypothetical protein
MVVTGDECFAEVGQPTDPKPQGEATSASQTVPAPEEEKKEPAAEEGIFPKSIRIPGTQVSVGFGGYAKVDFIQDFDAIGNASEFKVNSIPVEGTPASDQGGRTTIQAKETRFNVDFRSQASGSFRAFFEGDFYGDGNSFRLRHAFGVLGRVLGGQTWTTFMDISARPLTIDYEGPDAEVFVRQAMIRYTQPISEHWTWAIAVENPSPEFAVPAGATGSPRSDFPDVPTYFRFEKERGHVQLAALYRKIGFDGEGASQDESAAGWGLNGAFKVTVAGKDELMGQIAVGEGIGHYIEALSGTNSDAVFTPSFELEALQAAAAVIGYTHHWSKSLRSGLAYAQAELDSDPSLPTTQVRKTQDARANLIWTPHPLVDYGGEILWGRFEDQAGDEGEAWRFQFAITYRFN